MNVKGVLVKTLLHIYYTPIKNTSFLLHINASSQKFLKASFIQWLKPLDFFYSVDANKSITVISHQSCIQDNAFSSKWRRQLPKRQT